MQIILTIVVIALAVIGVLFAVQIVTGVLALVFLLVIPILIFTAIVYIISKAVGPKGLGGGNRRSLR